MQNFKQNVEARLTILENKSEEQPFSTPPEELENPIYRQKFAVPGAPSSITANRRPITISTTVAYSSTITTVTASVVGTTETNLATIGLTSPEIDLVGKTVRVTALGTYTSDATRTFTLRIGSGTAPTTEWNSVVSTAATATNQPWNLTWYGIVGTIGSSGTLEAQMTGSINNVMKNDANTATVTVNTTTSLTIALTAQWSASTAGNSITIRQFIVEALN